MKIAKVVALSAMTTAIATIFLVIGNWFTTLSLTGALMASVTMMLPLAKKSYKAAILSFIATVLLTGMFSGFFARVEALLPFVFFSGLHPVFNEFWADKKLNKVLGFIIKELWFLLSVFLCELLLDLFIGENEIINQYIYPIILIGGAVLFPVYDYLMGYFRKAVGIIVARLKI